MFSTRFGLGVHVTRHARERMAQRNINEALLGELLETGQVRLDLNDYKSYLYSYELFGNKT